MSPRKAKTANGRPTGNGASAQRKSRRAAKTADLAPEPLAETKPISRGEPVNQAEAYGVRVVTAQEEGKVAPGGKYWRLVRVRHLSPEENQGKHNAFVDAVDENGVRVRDPALRIGWTWEGRTPGETAEPKALDKPDSEPAGNVDIYGGMRLGVWITGDGLPSDRAESLHTNHPDEPGPNGELWNSIGHHSFALLFQRSVAGEDGGGGEQVWLDARYVAETIADLTMVRPGQSFVQTWTLENNGTQPWPEGSSLLWIGGEAMGSPTSVALPPTEPGARVDVAVRFVAPMAGHLPGGSYTSTWQPATADGTRFGDPVWLTVFVAEERIYLPHVQAAKPAQAPAALDAGLAGTVATTLPVQMVRAYEKLGLDVNAPIDPATGAVAPQVAHPGLAADTGVGWVRLNLILGRQWSHPLDDKRPQGLTWAETYRFILDSYRSRQLRIYALLGHESVAEGIGDRFRDAPGGDPLADAWVQQYAGTVLAIARLFRDQLEVIETFNEPDDWNGQGRNWIHPGWLAAMLEAVYRTVRSDPGLAHLRIVSGPLQGLEGPNKGNGAMDYLDRVYQHGIGLFGWGRDGRPFPFDGVGYHLYVHENATDDLDRHAIDLGNTYRAYLGQMLDVIRKHEGHDKPLYVSEAGWFSNGDNREFWEQFQAASMQLGLNRLLAEPAVALVFSFCLQDFGGPHDGKYYGVYRQGLLSLEGRKPAYEALRAVATSPNLVPTCERPAVYDSAKYVAGKDAVADETPFVPGAGFQQVWFLRNDGTTAWGPGYTMACVGGERMGAPEGVELPACAPGQETAVSVPHVAPAAVGRYTSVWQPCNAQGQLFGQRVWTIINVVPVAAGMAGEEQWLPMAGSVPMTTHAAAQANAGGASVRTTRSLQDSLRWLVRLGVIYEGALEKLPASGDAEAVALAVDAAVAVARRQLEDLLTEH
jgi:hypothetical protein